MTDEDALLKRIGLAVRLERVARGLSQSELAAAAGISRVTLGSIERGDHPASIVAFARLTMTTGMSLNRVLRGQSESARALLGSVPSTEAGVPVGHGQRSQERDNGNDGDEEVGTA